ncbi:alpha/beta hydrolase family protein [Sphingomonas sp. SRS2]|uniref:alpha/beta hydrolase family protein n=1 Tax=Sphingomonas sp. SRS2 TaxID=133190 RepID=UPI0006184379|nr:alpha/beta hydrolase family protein [Sphingomonas sp. SRS2]KKC27993.1 alpha/beta hydrolase [Sphingomonas sp. SRS2]
MTLDQDGLIQEWISVKYEETSAFTETYGFAGSQGMINLDGILLRPPTSSKTLLFFMHPSTAVHVLPMPRSLAKAGFHVLCGQNRYPRNDTALIFEKVLFDYGAYIRYAKEILGYEKVILYGWSGGGPLTTYYQAQAEKVSVFETPAGDPIDFKHANFIPGDAIIFQAGSISRARILLDSIDPSVRDEFNPDDRIGHLDLYSPETLKLRPFSQPYITEYREAQLARMRRITTRVKDRLQTLRKRGGAEMESCLLTHRTMADPRWVDLSIDPNDRRENLCVSGVPETVNSGPVGFGRFSTLRSWLSQWSIDDSKADAIISTRQISVPFLAIENSADEAAPVSHMKNVFDACNSASKAYFTINGANHYFRQQPELLNETTLTVTDWLARMDIFPYQ